MQHIFECDNCGAKIETGCFDTRDNHRVYYSPVVKYEPEVITPDMPDAENKIFGWIEQSRKSALTTLCITCVKM